MGTDDSDPNPDSVDETRDSDPAAMQSAPTDDNTEEKDSADTASDSDLDAPAPADSDQKATDPTEADTDSGNNADDAEPGSAESDWTEEIPQDTLAEAKRLTRVLRRTTDPAETATYQQERDRLVEAFGFEVRVRTDDDTLVCYPAEWLDSGTIQLDQIEDRDRAIEVSLSGPGDPDDWDVIKSYNDSLVARVRTEFGDTHAANARALASFMGNHYAKRMDSATHEEIDEFRTEYYPRNAWPTEDQREALEKSLQLIETLAKK
jgi:hypothetical protein